MSSKKTRESKSKTTCALSSSTQATTQPTSLHFSRANAKAAKMSTTGLLINSKRYLYIFRSRSSLTLQPTTNALSNLLSLTQLLQPMSQKSSKNKKSRNSRLMMWPPLNLLLNIQKKLRRLKNSAKHTSLRCVY